MDPKSVNSLTKLPLELHELPDDVTELKGLFLSTTTCFLETIDYLKSEIAMLKRFQYGQSSERKKKVKSQLTEITQNLI